MNRSELGPYPRRLTDRVTLLGNPFFSVYLVEGDGVSALIEVGITATAPQIAAQLDSLGRDRDSIRFLIATHGHADHLAGGPLLKELLPRAELVTGQETEALLNKPRLLEILAQDDSHESARLIELGLVEGPAPMAKPLAGAFDRTLVPGEVLDLGGIDLTALDAPGHAQGGLVFWEKEEGILFCSDSLGFLLPGAAPKEDRWVANFYVDLDDYLKTFNGLASLEAEWVCPGHCGAFQGQEGRRFISGARTEIEALLELIQGRIAQDDDPKPEIPEDLVETVFERHYIRQARLFTPEMMRMCSRLLIRRVLESEIWRNGTWRG